MSGTSVGRARSETTQKNAFLISGTCHFSPVWILVFYFWRPKHSTRQEPQRVIKRIRWAAQRRVEGITNYTSMRYTKQRRNREKTEKESEHVRVPDVRRIDGVLVRCHERGITLKQTQTEEKGIEKEGKIKDARTETKAKQLLRDFWPVRDKKFRRTEFYCHPSSNSIPAHAFRELPWLCIAARSLNIQTILSRTGCTYVNIYYVK